FTRNLQLLYARRGTRSSKKLVGTHTHSSEGSLQCQGGGVRRPTRSPTTSPAEHILDSAMHVMHARGLARTTTREIAQAAGLSEAALYRHFTVKSDIFLCVLAER